MESASLGRAWRFKALFPVSFFWAIPQRFGLGVLFLLNIPYTCLFLICTYACTCTVQYDATNCEKENIEGREGEDKEEREEREGEEDLNICSILLHR